jgi:hypothetical protein
MDTRMIRDIGPTVVVRAFQGGGDVLNAFEVLLDALEGNSYQAVRAVEIACDREGVDFDEVHKAIQGALNDRRSYSPTKIDRTVMNRDSASLIEQAKDKN